MGHGGGNSLGLPHVDNILPKQSQQVVMKCQRNTINLFGVIVMFEFHCAH